MNDDASTAKRAILIAGPTASGKSAVAMDLAERLGGVVINADSMQVYADLSILTARPTPEDMARVPHRLFGHVDAAEAYSVGRWLREVAHMLEETWAEGRVPILVGGTGLYFKALTQGLSDIPAVPDEVRTRVRAEAEGCAPEVLHAKLERLDPATAARLRRTDPQRVTRALEVFFATGRPLSSFQATRGVPLLPPARSIGFVIAPERTQLYTRIDQRFDRMLQAGALNEVARITQRNLDSVLPAMRVLGLPPLLAELRGEISSEEARKLAKIGTRHYAKRQITFARNQLKDFAWTAEERGIQAALHGWTLSK